MANLNSRDLALLIHELLDIPLNSHNQPTKGYQVVKAIIQAMTKALQRGEEIYIRGFGIFRPVEWKARRIGHALLTPTHFSPVPTHVRARRRIQFFSAAPLRAMLNNGTTYEERRAISSWKPL